MDFVEFVSTLTQLIAITDVSVYFYLERKNEKRERKKFHENKKMDEQKASVVPKGIEIDNFISQNESTESQSELCLPKSPRMDCHSCDFYHVARHLFLIWLDCVCVCVTKNTYARLTAPIPMKMVSSLRW